MDERGKEREGENEGVRKALTFERREGGRMGGWEVDKEVLNENDLH